MGPASHALVGGHLHGPERRSGLPSFVDDGPGLSERVPEGDVAPGWLRQGMRRGSEGARSLPGHEGAQETRA
eukprot:9163159-Pyramimonas_sp.AAC.1